MSLHRPRAIGGMLLGLLLAGCGVGDGSDIGPALPNLPDASCKVVVLDDDGRGVVGAAVTIGGNLRTTTGRNGRGDFLADPRGRLLVAIDASAGAAVSGDTLGSYQVALDVVGPDLPSVLYVPDLPAATSSTLDVGTQVITTTLSSTASATLVVPAGSSVGTTATAATVELRLGDLRPQHLPGVLPTAASGTWLFGRGVWIEPVGVTFTPGATLDMPDDLGVAGGSPQLFHLDPSTGEWQVLTVTATAGGGRIVAADAIAAGGLYVFGAAVAAATTVSGRIVDPLTEPLPDVMVIVDQWKTTTDRNGRFSVSGVAAVLADGSPRATLLEAFPGGTFLPVLIATSRPVGAAAVDVGDLVLDTLGAGNIRAQQVLQGHAEALRPARLSSLLGGVALATTSDANGQVFFEDVPADYHGFQGGRAVNPFDVIYGQSLNFLEVGRRWHDTYQFFLGRAWYEGGRRCRTYVSDALGGGPLQDAAIIQGTVPGQGGAGFTQEGGTLFITRDFAGRATATRRSARDGRVITHAFSIDRPNGEHLELPLQQVLRAPHGAFDRHGLVAGTMVGADAARKHEMRVTRRLSLQEWWDEIVEGAPVTTSVPLDVDPAITHDDFVVGVPAVGGNLAAIEYSSPGGLKTLEKVGVVADVDPTQAQRITRDIALDAHATDGYGVVNALLGAPPELDLSQLTLSLALQQPSGRIVDVARGLRGNHAALGQDLAFLLPPLTGSLAGHGWLALLDGSYPSLGTTVRCSALISLPRPSSLPSFPIGAVRFTSFPEMASPTNGATVPASGFTVQYTLPVGALHGTVELRSEAGSDTLLWQAFVPPDSTQFVFTTLPPDVMTPLVAGRTYTLTVSAFFGDGVVSGSENPYEYLSTFVQSIGAIERGVSRVLRRTIQITTN